MRVLNRVARHFGWTPIGQRIVLQIDDAAEASLSGSKHAGRLTDLISDGSASIELDSPILVRGEEVRRFLVTPRHEGYDFYALWSDFIAASMCLSDRDPPIATVTMKRV